MSLLIKYNLSFWKIKVYRASLISFLSKNSRKLLHKLKHRNEFFIFFNLCLIRINKNLLDTCITHSSCNIDNAFTDSVSNNISFNINIHKTAKRKPVTSLIKWTYSIRQLVWQHRYNPVYKIYTCTTLISLLIKRTVFLYIVAYICNMNSKMIYTIFFRQSYCIVKILCIFSVNSYSIKISKVCPSRLVLFIHLIWNIIKIWHNLLRKFNR